MHESDFVAGDQTLLRATFRNRQNKTLVDLTGATVRLIWRIDGGTKVTRVMTIVDAPGGVASYQFAGDEITSIAYGSTMTAEAEVTDAGGRVLTQVKVMEFKIRAKV